MQKENNYIIDMIIMFMLLGTEFWISFGISLVENLNEITNCGNLKEENKKTKKIIKLADCVKRYKNMIVAILMGINIVIGGYMTKCSPFIMQEIESWFQSGQWNIGLLIGMKIILVIILIYFFILFGYGLPKKMTFEHPERMAYATINVLHILFTMLLPFVWLLQISTDKILNFLQVKPKGLQNNVTEEGIKLIVNEGREQGLLEDSEVEMISNIMELDDKEVKDIMTHRQKVSAIEMTVSIEETLKYIIEEGYSRYPVYEEDIDNIIGIVHIKDIIQYYISERSNQDSIDTLMKKPYFVPDTQGIDNLFQDMQFNKVHMAIAIDEYGQTVGIITMEDILEEIVGNILDEYDKEEKLIIKQTPTSFLMKGMAPLEEVEKALGVSMKEELEDYDTLNGLLISLIGHIPDEAEHIIVTHKTYQFHIIDIKNKMIHYVKVLKEE